MDKIFPNILVYDKNFNRIGTLSIGGADPQAPYYDDLYTQELDTGADTYYFSTMSTPYTQDLLEIGNHVAFIFKNKFETFTITSLEYSHNEGYRTIGVYAEGIGFELLEIFMEKPEVKNNNNSGNNGGNDSDGDGDDNTDDEYADPDDVYLDENGIIIYDENGGTDYSDEDDVYVDENGVIIYKRSKNNSKNDTLEFKNISYPTFLNVLLKDTDWTFVCQPGLESVKHNITVRYDTNIYAILQDSMQAFRGVELEFCYEGTPQSDGTTAVLQRVVKAYKDGGRGSFVGNRFEYGTNVKGITKTQEVTDSEDDTILYVDNVGVDITYDVDFALKSAEIPDIEIGDTHYVIDNDFYPPMNIKARIGKIEISFSDSTRNKIYIANNKKIRGSAIEDDFTEDDIKDIIDDKNDEDDLIDDDNSDDGNLDDDDDTNIADIDATEMSLSLLTVPLDGYDGGNNYAVPDKSEYSGVFIDKQDLFDFIMNEIDIRTHIHSTVISKYKKQGIPNFTDLTYLGIEPKIEFSNNPFYNHGEGDTWGNCELKSRVGRYIVRKNAKDLDKDGDVLDSGEHKTHSYNLPSLVAALLGAFQKHVNDGDSGEEIDLSDYATKDYVNNAIANLDDDDGNVNLPDNISAKKIFTTTILSCNYSLRFDMKDAINVTQISNSSDVTKQDLLNFILNDVNLYSYMHKNLVNYNEELPFVNYGTYLGILSNDFTNHNYNTNTDKDCTRKNQKVANLIMRDIVRDTDGNGEYNDETGTDLHNDHSYSLPALVCALIGAFQQHVKGSSGSSSDRSLKENIRYIDDSVMTASDDLLEKADLYDFIVNQVDLCEFNFIGDDSDKIGFVANDYEGTKVGDKIVSRKGENDTFVYDVNNLLFSTIGALQEEVRIRDEEIASLKDRLARIEEMLDINNK